MCNKCQWWPGLPMLWAFWVREMNVHHHSCADIIQPFRQQLLKSKNSFLWHLSQRLYFYSRFCFASWTCTFLSSNSLFVLSAVLLILPNLVYKCTLLNFMGVWAQLSSPFLLIRTSRIKLSLYILIMWFP